MFLVFGQLACFSSSKAKTKDRPELFGNSDQSKENQTGDIVYYLPPEDGGGGATVSPPETCDPITILSNELTEAKAGVEYQFDILVQGGCGQYVCELIEASEWVGMNGCQLRGTPLGEDSFGPHEVEVRVCRFTDPNDCDQKKLTLNVSDDPKIVLYVEPVDSLFIKYLKEKLGSISKFQWSFDSGNFNMETNNDSQEAPEPQDDPSPAVILGREEVFIKVLGQAKIFDVESSNPQLLVWEISEKFYKLVLPNDILAPGEDDKTLPEITLTAKDGYGHEAQKTFDLYIVRNPCDAPLKIEPIKICQENDNEYKCFDKGEFGKKKINVDLGSKFHILFQCAGAEGPCQWSYDSLVKTDPEVGPCESGDESLTCDPADMLTENPNWHEVKSDNQVEWIGSPLSDQEKINKNYFQLSTSFIFDNHDLPWNSEGSNKIFEELKVEAKTYACFDAKGVVKAEHTHQLNYQLPDEGTGSIEVKQRIDDVWDTNKNRSWMTIYFKNGKEVIVDEFRFDVSKCAGDKKNEKYCEDPDPEDVIRPLLSPTSGFIDKINRIEISFSDKISCDHWCYDCDHDELDYDLLSLKLRSDYRYFNYYDTDDNCEGTEELPPPFGERQICDIDDDVAHSFCDWSDELIPSQAEGLYDLTPDYAVTNKRGIWKPRRRPLYPSD